MVNKMVVSANIHTTTTVQSCIITAIAVILLTELDQNVHRIFQLSYNKELICSEKKLNAFLTLCTFSTEMTRLACFKPTDWVHVSLL